MAFSWNIYIVNTGFLCRHMNVLLNKLLYYLLRFPWPVDLLLPLINKNGWLGTDFLITHTARNNDRTKLEMKYRLNCFSHVSCSCLPLLNFHVLCVYSLKYTIGKDYWGNIGTLSLCCLSLLFFLLHRLITLILLSSLNESIVLKANNPSTEEEFANIEGLFCIT